MFLVDTYANPTVDYLNSVGAAGACRYVTHQDGKNITPAEVSALHGAGKVIVLNFEDSATNAQGGTQQGHADAEFAVGECIGLGAPINAGIAIFYSVDFPYNAGMMPTVLDYFRAIRNVHGGRFLVGAYGDARTIQDLLDAKLIDLAWQTTAWSNGQRDAADVLYQDQYFQDRDVDEVLNPKFGGWWPAGHTPSDSVITGDTDDMSAQEVAQIEAAINALGSKLEKFEHTDLVGTETRVKAIYDATIGSDRLATTIAEIIGGTIVDIGKTTGGKAMNILGLWSNSKAWFGVLHQGIENAEEYGKQALAGVQAIEAKLNEGSTQK